jgi:hypothetical protein
LDWEFLLTFVPDMRYASLVRNAGLLMALSVALFVGCKKEKEQNGPSLTVAADSGVVTGDLTLPPGTYDLRFRLIAQKGSGKDDADLKEYTITGTNNIVNVRRSAPNGQNFTIDTTMETTGSDGQSYTITFTVTDKNNKSASKSFKITFQSSPDNPPSGQIIDTLGSREYSNRSDGKGTYLTYDYNIHRFDLTDRTGAQNIPDQILFLYYYRDQNPTYHSVIAPDVLSNDGYNGSSIEWDRSWSTVTSLRLPPSGVNFDNVTYDGIRDAFEQGQTVNDGIGDFNVGKRIKLESRTLIAFKQTRAGKDIYGLIKIEGLDNTNNNQRATLSVKVRRPN